MNVVFDWGQRSGAVGAAGQWSGGVKHKLRFSSAAKQGGNRCVNGVYVLGECQCPTKD